MAKSQGSRTGSMNKKRKARSRAATLMIVLLVVLVTAGIVGGGLFAYSNMSNKSAE